MQLLAPCEVLVKWQQGEHGWRHGMERLAWAMWLSRTKHAKKVSEAGLFIRFVRGCVDGWVDGYMDMWMGLTEPLGCGDIWLWYCLRGNF
jgi:hypothetical protein